MIIRQKKPKILITEPRNYSEEALRTLQGFGDVIFFDPSGSIKHSVSDVDYMVIRLSMRINEELLADAKNLRAIASPTTGLNHIDLLAAQRRGVQVISLKGEYDFLENIHATAELTWGLLLGLLRRIPHSFNHVKGGGWDRDLFIGTELHGKTLGIIGLGRIGRKIAKYGSAFGMKVIYFDVGAVKRPGNELFTEVTLDEIFQTSDIVSLHIPYNVENHGWFKREYFQKMKNGAVLLNTSRGEVIDEAALLESLISHKLSGAALDVVSDEHVPWQDRVSSRALLDYAQIAGSNLLITPHIGGATHESMRATEDFIVQKLYMFHQASSDQR